MEKKSGKKSGAGIASRLREQNHAAGQETGKNQSSGKMFNHSFGDINFQALIENAPDGIALVSQDGKFKYASPSALRMFGYSPEDFDRP